MCTCTEIADAKMMEPVIKLRGRAAIQRELDRLLYPG